MAEAVIPLAVGALSWGLNAIGGKLADDKTKEEQIMENKWSIEDTTTMYNAETGANKANLDADLALSKTLYDADKKANWDSATLDMANTAADNKYNAGVVAQKGALATGAAGAKLGYSGVRGASPLLALRQEERLNNEALAEQIRSGNSALTTIGSKAAIQSSLLTKSYDAKVAKLTTVYNTNTALAQTKYDTTINRLKSHNEYMNPLWDETPEEKAARTTAAKVRNQELRDARNKARENRVKTRITPQVYGQDW